jgi:hypothetical protein
MRGRRLEQTGTVFAEYVEDFFRAETGMRTAVVRASRRPHQLWRTVQWA